MLARALLAVGVLLLLHAAYSVYEDRQFFVAQDREPTDIPVDVSRRVCLFASLHITHSPLARRVRPQLTINHAYIYLNFVNP